MMDWWSVPYSDSLRIVRALEGLPTPATARKTWRWFVYVAEMSLRFRDRPIGWIVDRAEDA